EINNQDFGTPGNGRKQPPRLVLDAWTVGIAQNIEFHRRPSGGGSMRRSTAPGTRHSGYVLDRLHKSADAQWRCQGRVARAEVLEGGILYKATQSLVLSQRITLLAAIEGVLQVFQSAADQGGVVGRGQSAQSRSIQAQIDAQRPQLHGLFNVGKRRLEV